MPVIIGVARSGTTLLRLMLDAHPQLAIPPETGFVGPAAALARGQPRDARDALFELVTGFHTWRHMGVPSEQYREALRRVEPFDISEGVRAFYRLYASRFGKSRHGDKTPNYTMAVGSVARVLPEAHFIHIIRDGRDVALSVRDLPFSPGTTMTEIAHDWAVRLSRARSQASGVPRYMEVRFEDLVSDPRSVLDPVCKFIALPFDDAMLEYHERAGERLGELGLHPGAAYHPLALTQSPPKRDRAGVWRREMSREEREAFEAEAGDLLAELGYDV